MVTVGRPKDREEEGERECVSARVRACARERVSAWDPRGDDGISPLESHAVVAAPEESPEACRHRRR